MVCIRSYNCKSFPEIRTDIQSLWTDSNKSQVTLEAVKCQIQASQRVSPHFLTPKQKSPHCHQSPAILFHQNKSHHSVTGQQSPSLLPATKNAKASGWTDPKKSPGRDLGSGGRGGVSNKLWGTSRYFEVQRKAKARDLGILSWWSVKLTSHCFAVTLLQCHQSPGSHYHQHKTMPMSVVTFHPGPNSVAHDSQTVSQDIQALKDTFIGYPGLSDVLFSWSPRLNYPVTIGPALVASSNGPSHTFKSCSRGTNTVVEGRNVTTCDKLSFKVVRVPKTAQLRIKFAINFISSLMHWMVEVGWFGFDWVVLGANLRTAADCCLMRKASVLDSDDDNASIHLNALMVCYHTDHKRCQLYQNHLKDCLVLSPTRTLC